MSKVTRLLRLFLSMVFGITIMICLVISGCSSIPIASTLTPSPTPTTAPTAAAIPTLSPTPIPTTKPTATETTSELDGIPAERLQFVKDLLKIYENSLLSSTHKAFNKVDDYLTREQIINYGKTGEYEDIENFAIIMHKDGTPAIAMINCQENVVSSFKKGIEEMEAYDPNYLKILTNNGMRTFTVNRYNENYGSTYTFNKEGQFIWNATKEDLAKNDLSHALKNKVLVESYGIKFLNLSGEYAQHVGYYKEGLPAYCFWNLYCKNGQPFCKAMAYGDYLGAKVRYGEEYSPVDFNSETIQKSFEMIFNQGLVDFFGGTANEINENRKSMPDWNRGDLD